ncbi:two-component system response regulator [Pseudoroseomonas rhizosphaerae]|uniref:Two-component system response regulator n=1 Tax=Teichococcus rhizosphaerae TaxID=1335062 RepID=A0A2C7AE72_9PROT|nr:response regulator [Pseudoroseomonas rhizosphaerae]PHK94947.1 two-component system response regulator [Pseudoroseomonas rhizosphaerae]
MGEAVSCLVVDDSRVVRKAARRILERHGFEVREAEDGRKALDACRESLPRLVMLDWNMPVMDGLEFLRAARAEFGPDEPLIMLCTTESEFDRIVTALAAGAQEYIMKPFDDEIVTGKLVQLGLLGEDAEP